MPKIEEREKDACAVLERPHPRILQRQANGATIRINAEASWAV